MVTKESEGKTRASGFQQNLGTEELERFLKSAGIA
jgi:hypothetical protein